MLFFAEFPLGEWKNRLYTETILSGSFRKSFIPSSKNLIDKKDPWASGDVKMEVSRSRQGVHPAFMAPSPPPYLGWFCRRS